MTTPSNLMSVLNFTEADLLQNRQGQLSLEQQQRLRQRAYLRIFIIMAVMLLTLTFGYTIIRDNRGMLSDLFIPVAVFTCFMVVLLIRTLVWLYIINQGEVVIITGAVHLADETNDRVHAEIPAQGCAGIIVSMLFNILLLAIWRSLFPRLILTIGTSRFKLKRRLYNAFTTNQIYQLYCLNNEIIAAELLKA